jgi:ribonuclease HI
MENSSLKQVIIYTDGSCLCNPGVGGWGCVLMYNGIEKRMCGAEKLTTNNRMEMLAVIKALEALKQPCEVFLHSDSAYVINAFNNGWIDDWEKKNWKNSQKKDVLNKDLWEKICALTKIHKVHFIKVKGHSDVEYNNICDELARSSATKLKG